MLRKRLVTPAMPASVSALGDTSSAIIDVSTANALFASLSIASLAGGAVLPTLDIRVDYVDDDGTTIMAFAVVSFAQFTSAPAAAYVNVGPLTGGGGYILPNKIRLRFTNGASIGTPVWSGITLRLYQQAQES